MVVFFPITQSTGPKNALLYHANASPTTDEGKQEMVGTPYRNAVGTLIYLRNVSRPDVAYAVSTVSQFLENPGNEHWIPVKRIFRYLKGTAGYGILYQGTTTQILQLEAYGDADYAGDVDNRKSVSGHVLTLAKGPVS